MGHGGFGIVGGSIAGCAAALAASRGGADAVTVFERAGGRLADRGAGLAVHDDRYAELAEAGYLDEDIPALRLTRRGWYVRDGGAPMGRRIGWSPFPFRSYGWGPLWRELRRRLPDSVVLRDGAHVTRVHEDTVVTADGTRDRFDVVVGADGHRSLVRAEAFGDVHPTSTGCLVWRGGYPDERLDRARSQGTWEPDECGYVVFDGGHVVVYRIPDGSGGRRVNWVLYATPPPDLAHVPELTTPLPAPVHARLYDHAAYIAEHLLPPFWGQVLRLAGRAEVIVHPIHDLAAPRFATHRHALAGDAASVARPHTGAGAVKALQDCLALERALRASPDPTRALAAYDADRAPAGHALVALGRSLGDALVLNTPDWRSMGQAELDAWWSRADTTATFGGAPGTR
ncbi:monooxygenase (plasmid) [Streptomyces sp. BI20]|uniref:monooxygenase n=1 Tax=Streptomyces sp. BI20 TaxID=3403460 RepID=UPI003C75E8C2